MLRRGLKLDSSFRKDLEEVEELRNQIAHQRDHASDHVELRRFVGRLSLAEKRIEQMKSVLES